jgi:hypothetical protein
MELYFNGEVASSKKQKKGHRLVNRELEEMRNKAAMA